MHALDCQFTFAGFNFPRYLADLKTGPMRKRLEYRRLRCTGDYYHAPKPLLGGAHPGKGFYLASDGMPGLRWQWADETEGARIQHTGWFYNDSRETIRGIVLRLPHGRGFLAGWSMGESMASEVDGYIYLDEVDAARAADSAAEYAADAQRRYEDEENARLAAEENDEVNNDDD